MAELKIFRSGAVHSTVQIDEKVVYKGQFMGENKITASFTSPVQLELLIGDYIEHRGKQWRMNEVPSETKTAKNNYAYDVVFEGREYTWYNKQVQHLGVSDFSYFGTPLELIQLLVSNINTIDPGWLIGTVDNTAEPQHFSFKDQSCRQGLTIAAEGFGMEFEFVNRTINFKNTIGTVVPGVTLKQGKNNGLYSLTRQPAGDANVATRVYGYGSTQNIPADYRGGMQRLSFDGGKIDNNIAIYGVIETSVTFDDILPERTASLTGVGDITTVIDTTLDFDLNNVIVQGQAKIVFKSGDLQGNEFEITSYNHSTKTIKFNVNKEESGYILPNASVKAKAGDIYTLVGITMLQTYITAAEARLRQETINYANSLKHPPIAFGLSIDELVAKAKGLDLTLKLGDKLHTVDTEMGVDETLRVQAISYPIIRPSKITATITDKVTYTRAEKIRQLVAKQENAIREIIKGSAELQRISAIRREELQSLIFDPDGYFDPNNIKPLSINTTHIAVGSRSQEYSLSVIFKPNVNGDANRIDWTTGVLTHFTIEDSIKTWNISLGSKTGMVGNTAYYIYARCSKTGTTGTIVLDTVQRLVNSDANFYYFLVGVLSSAIDGIRWPTLTYGTTEINGGFVRTGRIESNDGKAYFDLTTSQFQLGDSNGGLDWNVTEPNQLTIVGRIVATSGNIGGVEIDPVTGKLQISLQKVTEAGATTDRIITAKGVRATDLLVVPDKPSTELGAMWYADGTDAPPVPDYILPIATANILGGIKVGGGLSIDPNTGVLSASFNPIGYATESWVNSGFVPKSRKVNGKELSGDITLTAADIGALSQSVADGRYIRNQTILQAGANFHIEGGVFTGKLVIPNVEDSTVGAIYYAEGTGADPAPIVIPIASATVLGGIKVGSGLTIDPTTGVLTANGQTFDGWTKAEADARFEFSFTKLTGFNKNFGAVAGTVMQGNDTRVVQAFGWGDFRDFGLGTSAVVIPNVTDADRFNRGTEFIMATSFANTPFSQIGVGIHIQYSGARGSQLWFNQNGSIQYRSSTANNTWGDVKVVMDTGNRRTNADDDARFVYKSGDTITGQLFIQGYATFKFLSNIWYADNTGSDRMYFGSSNNTNGIILRASYAAHLFQIRDINSSIKAWIEMGTGASYFAGGMTLGSNGANKLTLKSSVASGNSFIDFVNNADVREGYIGFGSANQNFLYYLAAGTGEHRFYSNNGIKLYIRPTDILTEVGVTINSAVPTKVLTLISSGKTTEFGSFNASYFHMRTDANAGFYMYQALNAESLIARTALQIPSTPSVLAGAIWYTP